MALEKNLVRCPQIGEPAIIWGGGLLDLVGPDYGEAVIEFDDGTIIKLGPGDRVTLKLKPFFRMRRLERR